MSSESPDFIELNNTFNQEAVEALNKVGSFVEQDDRPYSLLKSLNQSED